MDNAISDSALFYKKVGENFLGLCATYVDDSLHSGTKYYEDLTAHTEEKSNYK